MWWRANFGGNFWIDRVKIRNRRDCCGARLAGTAVFIGGKECGKVESGTSNGRWYTVNCQGSIQGDKIELKTTRNEYLSISGIEVWTGAETVETTTSAPSGKPSTIKLSKPSLNKPFSRGSYLGSLALKGGKATDITQRGVGMWW
jgi:hypothetical protein